MIQFVGANSAAGTTVTIPAGHQPGDLMIIFAFRSGSTTAPSLPAGWTAMANNGANTCSARIGYKIATSTSESSGTWSNATDTEVHVYRGQLADGTPVGTPVNSGGASTTVTYPAVTLTYKGGTSWIAGFAGHRSTNTTLETAPTGMTNRTDISSTSEVAGHDTNGPVTSWSSTNVSVGGTSSGWETYTVEIFAQQQQLNNYLFVKAGNGISVSEKIK